MHTTSDGTLLDESRLVEPLGMLRGGGHVDAALVGHFVDAKTAAGLQQTDDFDAAMVG